MGTKNVLIRNHIALIFAGLNYDKAVPYIIEKINDKETFNNNGTLVYALGDLDVKGHFISLIKIICEQEYEARLSTFGIIEDLVPSISDDVKSEALNILEEYRLALELSASDKGGDSALRFVEETKELLSR